MFSINPDSLKVTVLHSLNEYQLFKSPNAVSHSSFYAMTERKPSVCSHIMNEGFLQCSIIVEHTGATVGLEEPVGILLYLQNYITLLVIFKIRQQ